MQNQISMREMYLLDMDKNFLCRVCVLEFKQPFPFYIKIYLKIFRYILKWTFSLVLQILSLLKKILPADSQTCEW